MTTVRARVGSFCERFDLELPILLAPMAGACPPALSIEVMKAGGLGACGALPLQAQEMRDWAEAVRRAAGGNFQINLWIPDPAPSRDPQHEARVRAFLAGWGPTPSEQAGDAPLVDFAAQCRTLLELQPPVVSSVMGLYPAEIVADFKRAGVAWFAAASTVQEALAAEAAGADAIVAQGMEAGGHRAAFRAELADRQLVGLAALVPAVADAVRIPVVATGGIADARGVAAALLLGASAVQIGSAFLRCPEAGIHPAWAAALAQIAPEDTLMTRAFSGRSGRSIATDYALAAESAQAPKPAGYPVQRGLTAAMRADATRSGDLQRMQAWAGQSARLAKPGPALAFTQRLWAEAVDLLVTGYR